MAVYKGQKADNRTLKKEEKIRKKRVGQGDLWQAAEPIGDFVLVGCTVAPGWELEDEEYLSDHPEIIDKLIKLRPDLQRLI